MARLDLLRDERGAVYVEFLIAFFPLFLLFLGICQVALIATAEVIVRHAAYSGARTAIVALDDEPKRYDKAERGYLSQGNPDKVGDLDDVAKKLGIPKVNVSGATTSRIHFGFVTSVAQTAASSANLMASLLNPLWLQGSLSSEKKAERAPQQGARMVPIRTAAMLPLLPIAPSEALMTKQNESVAAGLAVSSLRQLGFAVEYTKLAALVTVHDSSDTENLASDPIGANAPVAVRVTYLYHCTIPIVRSLMCGTLAGMEPKSKLVAAVALSALGIARADARFKVLTATATLPNQGANYQR